MYEKHYLKKMIEKSAVVILLFSSWLVYSQVTVSQTYNYTGSPQTFTVPANVTSIMIDAWGAGGGGGGGNTTAGRGGGGGGAFTRATIASVTAGQVFTITIGQGGAGTGNPGTSGGTTSVTRSAGGTVNIQALGGAGGSNASGGNGGAATGAITGGSSTTRRAGGNGGNAYTVLIIGTANGAGGGGGGSAGFAGAGGNGGTGSSGTGAGGTGGAAGTGTPGGAVGGVGGTRGNNNAGAGNLPGSGGGGRGSNSSTVNRPGGTGAHGRVIITYTIPTTDLQVTHTTSNNNPNPGDVVTFTITVKNNKLSLAAPDVVLTALLPNGYTFISANQAAYNRNTGIWNIGTLAANTSTVIIITALVKDTGTYNGTFSVTSASMPDDNLPNNTTDTNMTICKGGATAPPVKE